LKLALSLFCAGFLFFGLAGHASAATYYIQKATFNDGAGLYYRSGAWPTADTHTFPSPNNIQTILGIGGPNTFVLDGGVSGVIYTDAELSATNQITAAGTNQLIRGVVSADPDYSSHSGTVTISCTVATNCVVNTNRNGFQLSNLTIYGPGAAGGTGGIVFNVATTLTDVILDNWATAYQDQSAAISTSTQTRVIIKNSGSASNYPIRMVDKGISVFNHSIFKDLSFSSTAGTQAIQVSANAGLTCNNCVMRGLNSAVVTTAGPVIFNNSTFSAIYKSPMFVKTGAGTITTNNCTIEPGVTSAASNTIADTTGSASIFVSPKFIDERRASFNSVSLIYDDDSPLSEFIDMCDYADSLGRGDKLTFALSNPPQRTAAQWTDIARIVANGHDVVVHSMSHSNMTETNAFSIRYTGSGSAASLTISGGVLTTSVTGAPGDNLNIVLGNTPTTDSVSYLVQKLNAVGDAPPNGGGGKYTATLINNSIDSALSNTTYSDIKTASTNIAYNMESFYDYEMTTGKNFIETGIRTAAGATGRALTFTTDAFVYPSNLRNSASDAALLARGFLGARAQNDTISASMDLNIYDIMKNTVASGGYGTESTDTTTMRWYLSSFASWVRYYGGPYTLWGHGSDIEAGSTATFWKKIIEASGYNGIQFMRFQDQIAWIRANYTDAGGGVFTKTAFDNTDLHLISSSPAIDAGTNVSLTSDYAGNSIYGAPDIGSYEYQPPYTVGTTPLPTSGSVRVYSNGKYRALTATSTDATISTSNFSVTPVGGSFYTASTSQYIDITIDSWSITGAKNKQWTATSSADAVGSTHATSTVYTIGDLLANTDYTFKVDGTASTTAITGYGSTVCTNGVCTSNGSGVVTFTYSGGYSTHAFALQDLTAPTGYAINIDQTYATSTNQTSLSFTFSGAEVGATYNYSINDTDSATPAVTGSGTVSSATEQITGLNVSSLTDSTLTLTVYLTDIATNQGGNVTDTILKDTTAPATAASVSGGTYTASQSVSLTCTDAGSGCNNIYYTTNGNDPTTSSTVYTSAIAMNSGYTVLKFFAADNVGKNESIHTENYSIITGSVSLSAGALNTASSQNQTTPTVPAPGNSAATASPSQPTTTATASTLDSQPITATIEQILSEAKQIVSDPEATAQAALTNFVSQGTDSTKILGSGERAGVLNSFTSAFGKAPQSEVDWSDVIKIANGRWPNQRDKQTETNAENAFKKIYQRKSDRKNPNDDAAVTVMAYGLRPAQRNLNSEKAAIKSFKAIYGYMPKSAMAWDIVRAIAYSGAKR